MTTFLDWTDRLPDFIWALGVLLVAFSLVAAVGLVEYALISAVL